MIVRLCEVHNSFLSFAVRHEFEKKKLYRPKKLQKTILLVHRFELIYYSAYSLKTCTILRGFFTCCIQLTPACDVYDFRNIVIISLRFGLHLS